MLHLVPRNELVNETFHSPLVEIHPDEAEPHVSRDFLAPHPRSLTTESSALKPVDTTKEHVKSLVIVARQYDVGLHSTREALNEFL
jgi:hypothetical protein